ncbi:MAG: O-antigen ligase family protein [Magnetococcales bacterium]|nr:O-antigen ligase family protein [Magnetococcales bacterium]
MNTNKNSLEPHTSKRHRPKKALYRRSRSPRYLFYIFLALIFCIPFPLGGNRPWAWSIVEVWIFLITMIWFLLYAFSKVSLTPAYKKALPVILLWSAWLLISTAQFIPIPYELASILSPNLASIYQEISLWGELNNIPLSISPYSSYVEWMKGIAYLLIFVMTLLLAESAHRLRIMGWVCVISATMQAILGIAFLYFDDISLIFASAKNANIVASGTFINRNHFANFLVINLSIGIGLIISGLNNEQQNNTTNKQKIVSFLRVLLSYKTPLRILLVIIVIGIILSRSRMGNISIVASLSFGSIFAFYSFKNKRRIIALFFLSFLIIDLALVGNFVGIDRVVKRIAETNISTETRVTLAGDTMVLIKDHWLFGAGVGSFSSLFPRYRSFVSSLNFKHPENDYLEFLSETGVIGISLLGFPVLLSLFIAIRVHVQAKDNLSRGFSFASIMGVSGMLFHASSDFILHIPANISIFMILLAIPWILYAGRESVMENNSISDEGADLKINKIIFLNRFFYPDQSATSQLLSDLAFDLAKQHTKIHVITSRMNIDNPQANLPVFETINGVHVHRLSTTRFGRSNMLGRMIDYLTFYSSIFFKLLFIARKHDIVVCKTDPPLLSIIIYPVVWFRQATMINWLQDLFPEIATALKIKGFSGLFAKILRRLRRYSLRNAKVNVVLCNRMARKLRHQGVSPRQIQVLHNWSDSQKVIPIASSENSIRHENGYMDRFVVGYSGNMGRVHDFKTILDAAELLVNNSDIIFEFVGSGVQYGWIKKEVKNRSLTNVFFRAHQPRSILSESLSVADVHMVSLLPKLEGLSFPSKLYGIAAVARPIIFIGDPQGDLAILLRKNQCGVSVNLGNSKHLADQIVKMSTNPELCQTLGNNARKLLQNSYDRCHAMSNWRKLLGLQENT